FEQRRAHAVYRIYCDGKIEVVPPTEDTEVSKSSAQYIYIDSIGVEHDFGLFRGVEAVRWVRKNALGSEKIYLVNASQLGSNAARMFEFRFTQTARKYISQPALASLIGALMSVGYDDVVSTGFSMPDGSP